MMDFDQAWDELEPGQRVRVSDGTAPVAPDKGRRYFLWRSHNHEGTVVEKEDGPPRAIKVELDPIDGATVAYHVEAGHQFEPI